MNVKGLRNCSFTFTIYKIEKSFLLLFNEYAMRVCDSEEELDRNHITYAKVSRNLPTLKKYKDKIKEGDNLSFDKPFLSEDGEILSCEKIIVPKSYRSEFLKD